MDVLFKKKWDQDQCFLKKSHLLTKKEPFFETKSKITKLILNSYMVWKKLFKIKITLLPWWKNWDNCTVLSSQYYGILDFEQFFWNHWNSFQVFVKPSEVSTFCFVFWVNLETISWKWMVSWVKIGRKWLWWWFQADFVKLWLYFFLWLGFKHQ